MGILISISLLLLFKFFLELFSFEGIVLLSFDILLLYLSFSLILLLFLSSILLLLFKIFILKVSLLLSLALILISFSSSFLYFTTYFSCLIFFATIKFPSLLKYKKVQLLSVKIILTSLV